MKKINDNIKLIIGIIVAIVISSMISIKAATTLSSTSVYYDTSKSGGSSSNVNGAIDELYSLTTDRDKLKRDILDLTWPVGSVYISTTDSSVESVQKRFGGTWVKYSSGTTLIGDDGTNYITNDETKGNGGSSSVTLSESNLPSHAHNTPSTYINDWKTNDSGSHTHKFYDNFSTREEFSQIHVRNSAAIADTPIIAQSGAIQIAGITQLHATASCAFEIASSGNHSHTVSGTIPIMKTTSCTNCSATSFSVQNPYTVVYMYKRTA